MNYGNLVFFYFCYKVSINYSMYQKDIFPWCAIGATMNIDQRQK